MKNPYARLRELCKIGQREFERKYGLSHTVMASLESGLYPDLSASMIEYLGLECAEKGIEAGRFLWNEYHQASLQNAYHAWQTEQRKQAAPLMDTFIARATDKRSPMQMWVTDKFGNPRAFCTTLKVPTATVTRYLTGQTRTMPKVVEQAFTEAGMSVSTLTYLKEAQESWTADYA